MTSLDLLFVADPRFPGGTSIALVSELAAAHAAGFNAGLLMVKGPLLQLPHPIHPEIRHHIEAGHVVVCDPNEDIAATLIIIHHPTLFQNLPPTRLKARADKVVLVVQHPEVDATGAFQYDLPRVLENIETAFSVAPIIAPAGVNVRRSMRGASVAGYQVLEKDWPHLIDVSQWLVRPLDRGFGPRIVIGRHSRPDPAKWPDTREEALAVYPDDEHFDVRILGGGLPESYGTPPRNWSVLPFAHGGVSEFLRGLDFYVYFHSTAWVEAFGRTILEALSTGLVVILPRSFEPQFGSAALYAEPQEVRGLIEELVANPERYRRQSQHARAEVERLYALQQYPAQIAAIAPAVRPTRHLVRPQGTVTLPERRVLFVSSNGIGLGHLTRQMALARRMSNRIKPIFLTMSHAFKLVIEHGYDGEFIPFHRGLGADPARWNKVLAEELYEMLNFYRPAGVVFDGNNPYPGMLSAVATRPETHTFWVRRAMWRQRHEHALLRAGEFDYIVEPGEIAAKFDRGPTSTVSRWAYKVAPITYLDADEIATREQAREELSIPSDSLAVCVQLGSGNNFEMSGIRAAVLDELLRHEQVFIIELRSPIRDVADQDKPLSDRHRILDIYPSSRYLRGFDFSVSAAGYNSFHELILAALPTLFIPNEAEEMDLQLARARFADLAGLGRLLRRSDAYALQDAIRGMLDATDRGLIRGRCLQLPRVNGATEAAQFIEESLGFVRTDFDIADADYLAGGQ